MRSLFWQKIETKPRLGAVPKFEEGLSLDYLPESNKYIHFGGYTISLPKESTDYKQALNESTGGKLQSSLLSKNTTTTLSKLTTTTTRPQSALLSGGSKQSQECPIIHLYDPEKKDWIMQQCTGRLPSKRLFHHSWYEAPYFFIYGGVGQDKKILADIYMLNCTNFNWKRFFSLEGPQTRLHASFVNMGTKKYVIGGASYPENLVLNEIWSLSFENVVWDSPTLDLSGIVWEKVELKDGTFPALKSSSTIKIDSRHVFVFGGYDQKGECTDISLFIDTENMTIKPFEAKGKRPGPRAHHKMIHVRDNVVCLFGGCGSNEDMFKTNTPILLNDLYFLNIVEGYWTNPVVGGYHPPSRCFFGMTGNCSEQKGQILVLGGKTYDKSNENIIYVLSEMDPDKNEAWGVVNEKEREKEQEMIKKYSGFTFHQGGNKEKEKEKQISKITLEISDAENMIMDQKKKIGELETKIKNFKESNSQLDSKRVQLKAQYDETVSANQKEIEDLEKQIKDKELRNKQNLELNENLKVVLAYEIKRRKLLEQRILRLQSCMKKSENFIICIDSFYNRTFKDSLLAGIIKEEILSNIEEKKTHHRKMLQAFKQEYEALVEEEKEYRNNLKTKKDHLKDQFNIMDVYKSIVSEHEIPYLESKLPS